MNTIMRAFAFQVICILAAGLSPRGSAQTLVAENYKIAAQDVVSVDVFNEKELTKEGLRVDNRGEIKFPLLGAVKIAGKTQREAEQILEDLLGKDYLVEPHVTISLKTYRTRTVLVTGAVAKPGAISIPSEEKMSIIEAIAQAGAKTSKAKADEVEYTHNGKTSQLSYKELLKKTPDKQIYLEPGDLVNIPESAW